MKPVIPFRKHPLSVAVHAVCYAMFLTQAGTAQAGPTGGDVVGGSGSIQQAGRDTTINQASQNLAINWQSFNVLADERVRFVQPNSSSIALNRILSNNGSVIAGRIDANGQVILANPNGVLFTSTASINVGGIIATGLDIAPSGFMNGQYIFSEVLGAEGSVINRGMINASVGGNVALLGKKVQNEGMIVANLGSVTLAAGKEAVLTFDPNGVLGVRVSKEVLQNELGVDPAVVNSGQIDATGGRVLLTASTSRDVFSQAVNTQGMESATSVVVHEDGSFTLGGGADVVNSGRIDVSTTASEQTSGRIVLLGENVTSSGELRADAVNRGGEIEVHAKDMTLLTEQSLTSAQSAAGVGGTIKVLGEKVGLLDQSSVNASGALGGGTILIGGDFQGSNSMVRNATRTYVGKDSVLSADATAQGNGGQIINWGNDYTWFYGSASVKGGPQGGDGGLVEISGKGLSFEGRVDTSAPLGQMGTVLFDPTDIRVRAGNSTAGPNHTPLSNANAATALNNSPVTSGTFNVNQDDLEALSASTNINLVATNDITVDDMDGNRLNLQMTSGSIRFIADSDGNGAGTFRMNTGNVITTNGGNITIEGAMVDLGRIETNRGANQNGGNITVTARTGDITAVGLNSGGGSPTGNSNGRNAGNISLTANGGQVSVSGVISANGSDASGSGDRNGGNGGSINISAADIALRNDVTAIGGAPRNNGVQGNGGNITFTGPVTLNNPVTVNAGGRTRGDISFSATVNSQGATQRSLSLIGDEITFGGAVGNTSGLSALTVDARNNVSVGSVDTSNASGAGGPISITSEGTVSVGPIIASGGGLSADGGTIQISASRILLNGDIISLKSNGVPETAQLTPRDTGANSVDIVYTGNFTSPVNITGGTGQLTLIGANRDNTWNITGDGAGTLSGNVSFTGINELRGNSGDDTFTFTVNPTANFATRIDGRGQASITGDTVNFALAAASAIVVPMDRFVGIESINGTNASGSTALGGAGSNTWNVTGTNSGTYNTNLPFIGFNNLTGGADSDTFTFGALGAVTGTVDGGGGTNSLNARQGVANIWTFAGQRSGSITQGGQTAPYVNFTNIQSYMGGTADWARVGALGSVNATEYDNFVGLIGDGATTLIGSPGPDVVTFQAVLDPAGISTGQPTGVSENDGTVALAGGNTLRFIDFRTLNGADGNDSFIMTASGSSNGTIVGGDGNDTLLGRDSNSTWTLTGPDSNMGRVSATGAASPYVANFREVENLTGGSGDDIFVVNSPGGGLTGLIRGGAGANTLNINSAPPTTVNVLTSATQPVVPGLGNLSIFEIQNVTANLAIAHILRGPDAATTWTITQTERSLSSGGITVRFSDFRNLRGGNNDDNFIITATGNLGIDIDGGAHVNRDTLDYSRPGELTVNFGPGAFAGVRNVETVVGNGTQSTLVGPAVADATWILTGINNGSITSGGFTMGFEGFNYLTGGAGNDIFNIDGGSLRHATSGVPGLIQGGGGLNVLNVNLSGTGISSGAINYLGSTTAVDDIVIRDTSTNRYDATYTPSVAISDPLNPTNSGNYEQLSYRYNNAATNTSSALDVNFRTVDSVDSQLRVNTFTVNGSNAATTNLANGNFTVGTGQRIDYANATNLAAVGGASIVANNVNLAGTLTLDNSPTVTINGLNAGSLALNNVGTAGSATGRLITNVGSLSIANAGPVYLANTGGLGLGPISTSNTLDIVAGGTISSSGPVVALGNLNLTATNGGNIVLTDSQNAMSGQLNLTGAAVQLNNNGVTNFASLDASSLNMTTNGNIVQQGPLNVSGTVRFSAPTASIVLLNANNNFNSLNVDGAAFVSVRTQGSLESGAIRADSINLQTSGGIRNVSTETARLAVTNTRPTGNPTITAAENGVNITNTGTVTASITNMGHITLDNLTGDVLADRILTHGGNYDAAGPLFGDVTVRAFNGSVRAYEAIPSYSGLAVLPPASAPNISGENVVIRGGTGIGRDGRLLSVRANTSLTTVTFGRRGYIYFYGGRPRIVNSDSELVTYSSLDSLTNQQLIEIESLDDIDPAIFTAVRNYYHEDVAILMPADQRLDDQKEEEDGEKEKR